MSGYYNRSGKPIDVREWARLFEDGEEKRVASDNVGGYHVSTVWDGLGHQMLGGGPPLIFETMLFGSGDRDEEQHRYSNEVEALAHHKRIVAELGAE